MQSVLLAVPDPHLPPYCSFNHHLVQESTEAPWCQTVPGIVIVRLSLLTLTHACCFCLILLLPLRSVQKYPGAQTVPGVIVGLTSLTLTYACCLFLLLPHRSVQKYPGAQTVPGIVIVRVTFLTLTHACCLD
jgi:hypothetical protein